MKKIWKMRKDSKAVSPVIATILMVAITVVLAAVLYVMVMGFGGPSNTNPVASFSQAQKMSGNIEKVSFGPFNKDVKPSELKIVIENNSGTPQSTTYNMPATDLTGALTVVASGTVTGLTSISYTDLAADKKVGNGDYLTLTFAFPGTGANSYKVSMLYIPTGDSVGSITFTY